MHRCIGSATHSAPVREAVRSSSSPGPETKTTRNPARRRTRRRAPRIRHSSCVVTPRRMVGRSLNAGYGWKKRVPESAMSACIALRSPHVGVVSRFWWDSTASVSIRNTKIRAIQYTVSDCEHTTVAWRCARMVSLSESQAVETDGATNTNPTASFAFGRRWSRTRSGATGARVVARKV